MRIKGSVLRSRLALVDEIAPDGGRTRVLARLSPGDQEILGGLLAEAVLTTHDAETFSAPDCATVVGWYRQALEMVGVDSPRVVEEECRAKEGAVCRYRLTWS